MTTYTRSVTASYGNTTITQNVNTTDTVEVTVSMPGNILVSTITASNCSRTPASMSSGSTCTVTFSGTGSYSVLFTGSTGGKEPLFYRATLNGTVSSASDTTPDAFSFTDKTGDVSTEQNSSVQITGINAATTVSRTSGTATFAVVGTSTTPSAGNFGTSNTTITNNQYLHVKQTTSSSYGTSLSTVMNVGGVTDTWTTTTYSSTYTLTAPTSIDEGSSGTINIATTNVSTGTSLYWSVTSPSQFTGSTTGTVTTDSSGAASFSVTPTADSTTEGALTVTARIRTGSQGGTIRASDTFVVNDTSTTPAADTTPNAFDLADVGPVAAGTLATTTAVTITGMDANCPCSVAGQGSPQLTVGSGGVWTTSSTINPNNTINVRLTAPTAYSSTHTATLTIGTETDDITVTSVAAPSGSGGSGTTGGTGSYGIKIFDTNGTTSVLSPSTRYLVRLTDPTSISLAATSGSNTLITVSGMADLSASNSDLIFEQFATVDDVPVTRESTGFRVTNNSGQVFNNIVYVVRF